MARIVDNSNTAQSGDKINGGLGFDHLHMDVGNSQNFAISLETLGVEHVTVRAQAVPGDSNNNMQNNVQIDAQHMDGVTL